MTESVIPCVCPDDESIHQLVQILARGAMSNPSTSELVSWAITALERGFDSLGLRLLAGSQPSDVAIDEWVQQLVQEFSIELPTRDRLLELYATLTAADMVAGSISVQEGCSRLKDVALLSPASASEHWIILDEELDLCREGYGSLEAIEMRIVAAARQLLDQKR